MALDLLAIDTRLCDYVGCDNPHHALGYCTKHYKEAIAWKDRPSVAAKHEFVTQAKLSAGCQICGYNAHPAALQYHHIDESTKLYSVASCMGKSWDKLITEMSKCAVLCCNCHNISHYKESYTKYEY